MPTLHLNWIDYIVIVCVVYSLINGWVTGIPHLISNLFSFLGSLWLSVKYHTPVGNFFGEKFGITAIWTTVLGYVIVAFVSELILSEIIRIFIVRIPSKITKSYISKFLGAFFCVLNNCILITFFLLIILSLPIRGTLKRDIKSSVTASTLVRAGERYGGSVRSSLNETIQELNKFFTIEPDSKDRVSLDIIPKNIDLTIDTLSEDQMLVLVNEERAKAGVGLLHMDESMQKVARAHSKDMFVGRYFSHYDAQGHDASFRMDKANITYMLVGENLAYAEDLATAHKGLMESEGHRKNILESQFHRIGIGVLDSGLYGRMFTQLFAD